ncbi:hypothetical protein GE21DRAFT_7664 [Neurospora crassa]|uniref:SCD domain-containing protein n=2 Tax=Neurospora crassa TaxID=5141 RepID=Q7RVT5_NEUCR|nr:hypothetical protein NCU01247 [Neurospora crassa OR74A]EAA31414.3 hypothetical protein NCU01247 [Neurospora crassa OR74A]KHE87809.1 hypothetical protein GE21DRAFT_7664 [Neurospora crassa]CAC28644.1 related to nuclear protein SA-1 [Neurospora crassa]|eukprot:XP_960650.3 hypothetical protein NCU01247 [Neurospora crassa OR74A]
MTTTIRQPLMETTDNTATSSPTPTSTARRSGRVTKAPAKFTPEPTSLSKRKRASENDEGEDGENESPEEGPDEDDDPDASEVEQERQRSRKRKPSSQSAKAKKPALKKPKINGDAPSRPQTPAETLASAPALALNSHASLPSRPKKSARVAIAQPEGEGLYTDIFRSDDRPNEVATRWYHQYQADHAEALTDLVNCILLSAGCDQRVTEDDIRDPDNCQNRLADLQNVYAEVGITDYPLISRARSTRSFRDLLVGFFRSLVDVLHETDALYKDVQILENISRWVASMSSSTLRPFRHTATTIALAIQTALVKAAGILDGRISNYMQQLEKTKGKGSKNAGLVESIQQNLTDAEHYRDVCKDQIQDIFDTVFVHRYRDIDAKIRTECVEALGNWIHMLPTVFMEPEYLRYLGWMLSDVMPHTRHEVLKQLGRIFKNHAEKLGHFIDRFRPRLVEMATKDSDVNVRVVAISNIQILKDSGNLEPDEIDSIGRLIFDPELRIRKAVLDFFAGCVNDSIENKVEEIGGEDAIDELFQDQDEEDFSSPRSDWVSIKCLAELLAAYDTQIEEENPVEPPRNLDIAVDAIPAVAPETRISLAGHVLYEKIDQLKNWELLSGYLLYDHSSSASSKSASKGGSVETALRRAVAPEGREEAILLEVLASAVRSSLAAPAELEKSKKHLRSEGIHLIGPEEAARKLASIIPKLLSKYGADASTAVTVLRLEHSLDLNVYQQLGQDSTTYDRLLTGICTQFDRHIDRGVLAETTTALLHGRKYPALEETIDEKVSELWDKTINKLRQFDKSSELGIRRNLEEPAIIELGNILLKTSKLVTLKDCIEVLEADGQVEGSESPAIEILIRIVMRGKLDQVDENLDDPEDEAVSFAVKTCLFYFLWKARVLRDAVSEQRSIPALQIERLNTLRQSFVRNLVWTLSSRGTNDDLRLFATGALCDLHVAFASVRRVIERNAAEGSAVDYSLINPLLDPIDPGLTRELIEIFTAAERAYARCINRQLNNPGEDEGPIEHFSSDEEDDEDEDDSDLTPVQKKRKELKAERVLCELTGKMVLAIVAKVLDQGGSGQGAAGKIKKRMVRNQNKLGPNFKETLAYLVDEGRAARVREAAAKAAGKKKRPALAAPGSRARGSRPAAAGNSGASVAGKKQALSAEIITAEDNDSELSDIEIEEEEPEAVPDPEERTDLVNDPIEDHDEDEGGEGDGKSKKDDDGDEDMDEE